MNSTNLIVQWAGVFCRYTEAMDRRSLQTTKIVGFPASKSRRSQIVRCDGEGIRSQRARSVCISIFMYFSNKNEVLSSRCGAYTRTYRTLSKKLALCEQAKVFLNLWSIAVAYGLEVLCRLFTGDGQVSGRVASISIGSQDL